MGNTRHDNVYTTTNADLCTGCGICEGACPTNAIAFVVSKGNFRPKIDMAKCINCGRCLKACPGIGIELTRFADTYQSEVANYDRMVGRYEKCFTGHSNEYDIRYHSASGGMVSQFLIWLLENKKIDGAVVTKFKQGNPLLVETFIATTRDEIILARSSKYAPVTLNRAAQDIKAAPGSRYVVVGLPCHIHGMRKLMEIDKKLRDKVIGMFGLYCSSGRSFYLTEHVFKERGIQKDKVTYFQYRDEGCLGKMLVKVPEAYAHTIRVNHNNSESVLYNKELNYKEHFQSYYHPLRSFFVPRRCLFCIDHYAELADISFGDIHIKPYSSDKVGINSLIVKNKVWLNLLRECERGGAIHLDEVEFKTISDSQKMAFKKKGRNGAFINIGKNLGWTVPQYDVDNLRQPTIRDWIDYCQNRIQQFLGNHKAFWPLISKFKSRVNIN